MNEYFHSLIRAERRGWRAWFERGGLWLLSGVYGLGVGIRNLGYSLGWRKAFRISAPVISVGNLTAGGTGKTPCVEYLARFFRERDLAVAILSRGYGSQDGRNDEARVLEENLPDVPHLQGPDRVALANTALEELESELLLLDDGFQHRRLHRDLDVVLIDATNPWGYGYLLPRGLLRESLGGLTRANVIMITRTDLVSSETVGEIEKKLQRVVPGIPVIRSAHRPSEWINAQAECRELDALKNRLVAAFCGLGNPRAFRQTLESMGMNVIGWRTFPDHHPYSRTDVDDLIGWATSLPSDTVMVTTQKDLVKLGLNTLGPRELWALAVRLEVLEGQEALQHVLTRVLDRTPA